VIDLALYLAKLVLAIIGGVFILNLLGVTSLWGGFAVGILTGVLFLPEFFRILTGRSMAA
jgi:hypothetical protein